MNSGKDPELVFVQEGTQQTVLVQDTFDELVKKAKQWRQTQKIEKYC